MFMNCRFSKIGMILSGNVLGGWQASGIITYSTGLPLTPVINSTLGAFDAAGLGIIPAIIAGTRPNVTCDPNQGGAGTQQQWFNTSCFTPNPLTTNTNIPNVVGSAGRGIIEGPSRRRVDFTLTKNIRFNETMRLQLRGEAFNIFNWVSYNTVDVRVNAATFGQVTGVRDPRILQFGAKFYW